MSYVRRLAKYLDSRLTPTRRSRRLPGIPGRVHFNDTMLFDESESSVTLYMRAANSAVEVIERILDQQGTSFESVGSLLDFGCGHGRVLRLLSQKVPPERITACDVDAVGVRFCAAEFGVQPLVSSWDLAQIQLDTYDVIWSGSVFTHLDADGGDILLGKLASALEPGGLLIFSMHGDYSLGGLEDLYEKIYADEAEDIRREVAETGFSFRAYDERFGTFPGTYGMSWHTVGYLEDRIRKLSNDALELVTHEPQGWDLHHDVVAFRRRDRVETSHVEP